MAWPWFPPDDRPRGWYLSSDGRQRFGPLPGAIASPDKMRPMLPRETARGAVEAALTETQASHREWSRSQE